MFNQDPLLKQRETDNSAPLKRGPVVLAIALLCTTAISLGYFMRERDRAQELAASRDQAQAAMAQTRSQIDELNLKLNTLTAERAAAQAQAQAEARAQQQAMTRRAQVVRAPGARVANDPRVGKLQDQLAQHQKDLAGTKEDLRIAREELQGKLDTTRDELNTSITKNHDELNSSLTRSHDELSGSIAKNHDELVELQKRGERNYYEFELSKSKQFQRTGPLSLSLRNADTKRKRYDLKMLVDDAELEKKRVNVYEPVMVYLPDRPQPLELVVNQVDKNRIKGYLSEPKYKKSDMTAATQKQQLTTRP